MSPLIERLPPVRGRCQADASLARLAWMRVGGPADVLFQPADVEDLQTFLAQVPAEVPLTVIGVASNMLIRDGGIEGVVIRLGGALRAFTAEDNRVRVGAGLLDRSVAIKAAEQGLAGLEFFVGIPGTIGGAVRMNAGAFGGETKDRFVSCTALDRQGTVHELTAADLGFAYRHSELPADWIVVEAVFETEPGDTARIRARIEEIKEERAASQPIKVATGGSTFKNPPGESAWRLIDRAGCRGRRRGGAQVSEKHCNFLINTGDATAADLERLGEEVREIVAADSDITLEWEIRRVGRELVR
ncbi:MAG: UDP-N-acetylmuramate dehydrogenase [Geminicoccaceae bacterium]